MICVPLVPVLELIHPVSKKTFTFAAESLGVLFQLLNCGMKDLVSFNNSLNQNSPNH